MRSELPNGVVISTIDTGGPADGGEAYRPQFETCVLINGEPQIEYTRHCATEAIARETHGEILGQLILES